jgi:hypothetical protein
MTANATFPGMAKRYASGTRQMGSPTPPGGWPSQRLYRAVAKAISTLSKATGKTPQTIVAERFPEALDFVYSDTRSRSKTKPPKLDC